MRDRFKKLFQRKQDNQCSQLDFGLLGEVVPFKTEEQKELYTKSIFSNGRFPSNFSITLGVAPCNHTCIFCPQSIKKPKRAGWLDLDVLSKALSEMPETGMTLNVSSYSETLAAPNLIPAIALMKEIRPNLPIVMASNGSLFKEEKVKQLIDLGLDHYSYSFDAPNKQAYEKMMQVDHFECVERNLERLCELRNEKQSQMKITTHIMGFHEFKHEFIKFRERWMSKIDGVSFRPVGNWGGENWNLAKQWEKAGFTPIHQAPAERYPCSSIFMHFKLQWDGRYGPCVACVPDYVPEEENHRVSYLGHVNEITFREAWRRLRNMRRAHLEGNWEHYAACRSCDIWSLFGNVWEHDSGRGFYIKGVDYIESEEEVVL